MGEEDRRVPPSQTKVRLDLPSSLPLSPSSPSPFLTTRPSFWLRLLQAWYHSLKGKSDWIQKQNALLPEGAEKEDDLHVECLVFPGEGHALDGVEAEIVGFEAGFEWFRTLAKF